MGSEFDPPLGIKIIAIMNGLNAIFALGIGIRRLLLPEQNVSSIYPAWLIIGLLLLIGGLFSTITIGLWRLKRWAWWSIFFVFGLVFFVMCIQLIQHRIFPDLQHWWHFYLYPVLFGYLLRPSIRRRFKTSP